MGGTVARRRRSYPRGGRSKQPFHRHLRLAEGMFTPARAAAGGRIDGVGSLPYKPRDFDAATPTTRGLGREAGARAAARAITGDTQRPAENHP
jgi:hypothetical protein